MFKEKSTEEIIRMVLGDNELIQDSTGIKIKIKEEKKNYTLLDLRQKLIDYLMDKFNNKNILNEIDVDLIKILFD